MLVAKNPYIKSAYKTLQIISQNDEKRLEYEAREKAIRDFNQGMLEATEKGWTAGWTQGRQEGREEGRQEGRAEGRQEGEYIKAVQFARNLLAKGFDPELTAELSGLSPEQIHQLPKA